VIRRERFDLGRRLGAAGLIGLGPSSRRQRQPTGHDSSHFPAHCV
jgi:hypothetical protein